MARLLRNESPPDGSGVIRRAGAAGVGPPLRLGDESDGDAGVNSLDSDSADRRVHGSDQLQWGHQQLGCQRCSGFFLSVLRGQQLQSAAGHVDDVECTEPVRDVCWRHGLQPAAGRVECLRRDEHVDHVLQRVVLQSAAGHVERLRCDEHVRHVLGSDVVQPAAWGVDAERRH